MTLGSDFEDVLAAARAGAEWAVGALYRDIQPALLRYLRTREHAAAEDIASEVWLAAGPLIAAFEGSESELRKLLFSVAHRRLVDHWRKTRRRGTHPAPNESMQHYRASDDTEAAGIQTLVAQEALDLLRSHLTDEQADVVVLRIVAGLSVDEVAAVVGKRPGAVRALQHRALTHLASVLSREAITR